MSYLTNFTVETGRAILVEIIKTVNQPENSKTISLAKASAGKEMIAMMQLVFPLVMKIQIDVITNFGFPGKFMPFIYQTNCVLLFYTDAQIGSVVHCSTSTYDV